MFWAIICSNFSLIDLLPLGVKLSTFFNSCKSLTFFQCSRLLIKNISRELLKAMLKRVSYF